MIAWLQSPPGSRVPTIPRQSKPTTDDPRRLGLTFLPSSSRPHFTSLTSAVVLYSMAVLENPVLHVPALITTLPPSFPPSRFSPA
ncbi:hypothetical protein B0H14DRAFT_3504560 [Mycena olivaceomarginata]|nr:hypothetical protein B0H14DRAFT_3504560 [Mycena olivaceomarginata]